MTKINNLQNSPLSSDDVFVEDNANGVHEKTKYLTDRQANEKMQHDEHVPGKRKIFTENKIVPNYRKTEKKISETLSNNNLVGKDKKKHSTEKKKSKRELFGENFDSSNDAEAETSTPSDVSKAKKRRSILSHDLDEVSLS